MFEILNQGNQGACQGQALAGVFSVCFFLATDGRKHSRGLLGTNLSQRRDNIRGDNGSTLSGGQWVAKSMECAWRKIGLIKPIQPARTGSVVYHFKLKTSRPMTTVQEVTDWIDFRFASADRPDVERFLLS